MKKFMRFTACHPEALAEGTCKQSLFAKVRTLVRSFANAQDDGKKKAFTLAEVLITLGIIGVIAAITIPAVIQNTQSQETVVKLKKAYNTLKMVERQAMVDHGPMSEWAWTGTLADFDTFFKPYFDIMKDCGTGTGCFGQDYYGLNGNRYQSNVDTNTSRYRFMTSDGMSYYYSVSQSTTTGAGRRGWMSVDINGPKAPNIVGKDYFCFEIFPTLGIKPSGAYDDTTAKPRSSADIDARCSASSYGDYCATKVLSENAINY